jgi:putative tricarboxylic transport membrane protein
MEALGHLLQGFAAALTPGYLLYAFVGCMLGTLIGVLPGLGPAAGTAILIPLTFSLDATGAIIMLCAIYYGAMYGGTITSVLINVPGEAASVVTCIDGHQMAKQGRAGSALGIAAIGSFVGGTLATVALVAVAMPLASLALKFGPAEFFALMVAGLFGVAELLLAAEKRQTHMVEAELKSWMPTGAECRQSVGAIGRGTVVGFVLGLIPGVGAIVPTFMAYVLEKRVSKTPERFGKGAIEGVASAETANNAYANASMVPLLALGIPSSPTIAVLMGAFIVNGITPGPFLFKEQPQLVWTVIASFFVGNALLLILNLPLVGLWAKLLKIPFSYMCAGVLIFCVIGAYGLKQSLFDVWVMLGFGILGYLLRKLDFPIAPAILALILGPMMERSLRTTLEISGGSFAIFLDRPVALALLTIPVIVIGFLLFKPRSLAPLRESDIE